MNKVWENVNINSERVNGLKLRVAQIEPKTTVPRLLDHVLSQAGIELLTHKELEQRLKEMEVQV